MLDRLSKLGFAGPLVIERESGPNVRAEVREARDYLQRLLS
jgi:sugar phosphate isomerase/epimerase